MVSSIRLPYFPEIYLHIKIGRVVPISFILKTSVEREKDAQAFDVIKESTK